MIYLKDFLLFLKESYYAKISIEKYEYIIKKADKYFLSQGINNEREISEKHINDYLIYLKKTNASNSIYTKTISNLKKYFKYLEDNKLIFITPMKSIENIKEIHKIKNILTEEEIKELLDKIPLKTDWDIRFKAIMELMYSSSLRPSEVINLKITDIDFKEKILFIEKSKYNKTRIVPITENALDWLEKYIKEVRIKYIDTNSSKYVFVSKTTKDKLRYRSFHHIIERAIVRYKLKHFNPHLIRATSATHLLNKGMNVLYIQQLLGHEDIYTTQMYLRIKVKDLVERIKKYHPRYTIKNKEGE